MKIVTTVPKSRLLVVKTHEIDNQKERIAAFLGIPPDTLDFTKSHAGKSLIQNEILCKIDKDYLVSKVNVHCKVLMDQYFPGFTYGHE